MSRIQQNRETQNGKVIVLRKIECSLELFTEIAAARTKHDSKLQINLTKIIRLLYHVALPHCTAAIKYTGSYINPHLFVVSYTEAATADCILQGMTRNE